MDIPRLTETAAKHQVKFMVAQVLRFWPEYERIKDLYENRQYGRLLSGSMSRLGCYPAWSWDGWMMDERRSGLVPFDLHIHDLISWCTPSAHLKTQPVSAQRKKRRTM